MRYPAPSGAFCSFFINHDVCGVRLAGEHVGGRSVARGELIESPVPDCAGVELAVQWVVHEPVELHAALVDFAVAGRSAGDDLLAGGLDALQIGRRRVEGDAVLLAKRCVVRGSSGEG